MTYNENIERLRQTSNWNTAARIKREDESAKLYGERQIADAKVVSKGLGVFSDTLKQWAEKDKEKQIAIGKEAARKAQTEDAEKLYALSEELKTVKEQDTRYQEIKAEMLKLSGPDVYPEADRLAKLSPWAQASYATEKLRRFNETFDDHLAYEMQNSEKAISIQGITFTPKELRENNIQGLPFKEAAIHVIGEDIKDAAGIHRFSPEIRRLAGTSDAVQKAKDQQLGKYRERYNIDASHQTRAQAALEWQRSEKTGDDLYRMLVTTGATVNGKNQLLGNTGAWEEVSAQLVKEGVALSDPSYADTIGNTIIPPQLALQVGAKQGTTFKEQWPARFNAIKSSIKSGYVDATNAELKFQKADGVKLEAEFIEEARKGNLSSQEVNEWKRKFGDAGLPIPSGVTNYETVSDRDQREDSDAIKALMASQNGYISNEQLDQFHPLAALEYREKAAKLEKAALKEFDAEKKIKAHLDTAFTNMGIKANEKSPAYVEAMYNAKQDYAQKYNRYVAMGYDGEVASHLALHANEVKDPEGQPIPDSMGVLAEIKQNGENSKYVITGQSIEKELPAGDLRVARIASGKREIKEDPDIIFKGTIGGDYGRRQLVSVIENINKFGVDKGVKMDKGAKKYYEGLARGRDGNWMGLLDAQLKANGHEGLWPTERPPVQDLFEGKTMNGEVVEDPTGLLPMAKHMERAGKYPSAQSYVYCNGIAQGCNSQYEPWDYWERPEMRLPWIGTPPFNPNTGPQDWTGWNPDIWDQPFNPNVVSVKTGGY